jgi:hypothetical protein
MTTSRLRKNARSARRSSIGHGTARRDIQISRQIGQRLATFIAARRSFIARNTAYQLAALHRLRSAAALAAPKSP